MTLSHPAEGDALVERRALRDELVATADQLVRAETQAGFAGLDTSVRVKDPGYLASVLRRAAGALEVRAVAALSAENARLRREVEEARQHREHWQTKAQATRTIELEATARASAVEARAERLEGHLRSALAYLDADADLEEPDHEVSRVEAVDLRTGETRVFDVAAARAALQPKGDDGEW